MSKQTAPLEHRALKQCLFTTTATMRPTIGLTTKTGTLPSQRSLAPRIQAANASRQSSVDRSAISFRTSQGIKMSAVGKNGSEIADFNRTSDASKFVKVGDNALNGSGKPSIEGVAKGFQARAQIDSGFQNKYAESKINSFQGNSFVKKEQFSKPDKLAVNAMTNMPSKMDQVRDLSMAAKAENVNKATKEWIDQMSSVIDN